MIEISSLKGVRVNGTQPAEDGPRGAEAEQEIGVLKDALSALSRSQGSSAEQSNGTSVEERLATLERRVDGLAATARDWLRTDGEELITNQLNGSLEEARASLESARAEAERSLVEQIATQRAEAEEAHRSAEQRVAETAEKLTRKQRHQELKLARQERDRKIQEAERRLPERAQQLLAEIEREGAVAEKRVSTAREHAERALDDVIGDAAIRIQNRVQSVLDIEGKLVALLDQSAAAAERVRVADERASVAEHHVLEIKQAVHR